MKQIEQDVTNNSNRVESGTHPVEFRDISVIQLTRSNEVVIVESNATVPVSDSGVVAHKEMREWNWLFSEITEIDHELENSVLLQTTELHNFGLCFKAEDKEEFLGLVKSRHAESIGELPASTTVVDSNKKRQRIFSMRKISTISRKKSSMLAGRWEWFFRNQIPFPPCLSMTTLSPDSESPVQRSQPHNGTKSWSQVFRELGSGRKSVTDCVSQVEDFPGDNNNDCALRVP